MSLSSFGQLLFQGCLCKSLCQWLIVVAKCWPNAGKAGQWPWQWMTPSLRRMRRCRPAISDALRRQRRLATTARGLPTYQPPPRRRGWPRRHLGVACTPPDALPPPRVLYERRPSNLETEVPRPSVDLYAKFWTFFNVQKGGQLTCGSTYAPVYTVREFSRKIGLAPCEENCIVH